MHGHTPIRDDCGAQPSESEEVISTAMGGDWEHRSRRAARGSCAVFYESAIEEKQLSPFPHGREWRTFDLLLGHACSADRIA